MAFSEEERYKMHLLGLLPPGKFTQNTQVKRVMRVIRGLSDPTEQHLHLLGLLERNERLFYRVLVEHQDELFPIIYTPTVGRVCKKFSEVFYGPRALYITSRDKGRIYDILKNWPEKHLKLLVVTDGERVMGLGDLGVQGIGVAVAKSCLYTSMGGLDPADVLPVCIDVGTNNESLLNDPLYIGQKTRRVEGEAYDELMDEFVDAVKLRFGDRVIVQFEDFSNQNGKRLQERYATRAATFNDDISGVAATTLAGVIASLPKTGMKKVGDHTFLVAGAGETGTGIGEMIAEYIAQDEKIPINEARKRVWMVDSKGLITRSRAEKEEDLALHKLPWAHGGKRECATVLEAVEAVRPTALIGAVLQKMGECAQAPLVFALSRPENIAECTAKEAYDATGGRCVFAGGCQVEPFVHAGRGVEIRASTSAYVFPGFAYGLTLADAHRVRTPMWLEAAEAVASMVTEEDLGKGAVYPRMAKIREVSAMVAARVAMKCHEMGVASIPGKPPSSAKMLADAKRLMYNPAYRCYM
ncbi:malic oxidoreductase mitochondrial precursor [Micromonas commoda]|uniref:Malic oxidoreductase mitochondrial n=1 Tax=Micromonas commoda (strain RCC299 / NOUM17 / CCMP2709) TaxID=296587 RepID=C1FFL1_MICCC|nr:malic oxidoreductase mitochondrial precursor [Micromonas commoda]ACO69391.1 malic oxidoreductase mitochondrial precursor [Micromonas commoda]|eukprot:XP_002508133.1 malic oxidoreductase mitochondrial precursor [Micromonas commoda]